MTTDLEHSTNCIPKNSIFERARAFHSQTCGEARRNQRGLKRKIRAKASRVALNDTEIFFLHLK